MRLPLDGAKYPTRNLWINLTFLQLLRFLNPFFCCSITPQFRPSTSSRSEKLTALKTFLTDEENERRVCGASSVEGRVILDTRACTYAVFVGKQQTVKYISWDVDPCCQVLGLLLQYRTQRLISGRTEPMTLNTNPFFKKNISMSPPSPARSKAA